MAQLGHFLTLELPRQSPVNTGNRSQASFPLCAKGRRRVHPSKMLRVSTRYPTKCPVDDVRCHHGTSERDVHLLSQKKLRSG